jgi:hypothetical protein
VTSAAGAASGTFSTTRHACRPAIVVRCRPESSNLQLDNAAVDDMRIDDLVDIVTIDIGVPNRVGIDDEHRAFVAAIEAAGLVMRTLPLPARSSS